MIVLFLLGALAACTARQEKSPDAGQVRQPAPAEAASPVASFARLVSGEWRVTFLSGTSQFVTWHWGPGKHSLRGFTDGSDAVGNPWRALHLIYWHPGRKHVAFLGLSPFARGVMDGTIRFEGETVNAVFFLYQTIAVRKMGLRWDFDGPDRYHSTLLEEMGPAGLQPVNEWDYARSTALTPVRLFTDMAPKLPEHLSALEALVGRTWETRENQATGETLPLRSTFEWLPFSDWVYARVLAPSPDSEPRRLLDVYIYSHTGMGKLRVLGLSDRGGVYEGDVIALADGALELDLKGYEGDRTVSRTVSFDFEKEGTLRQRVWSVEDPERRLLLDVRHKEIQPKNY